MGASDCCFLAAAVAAEVQKIKTYVCPAYSSHLLLSAQTSLALFKSYSDSLGGVCGSLLKPNDQMMAVEGCLSAAIPCRDVNLYYSTDSCMEIGSWKYSGETILLLVQTILKLFLVVVAFVGVMVE